MNLGTVLVLRIRGAGGPCCRRFLIAAGRSRRMCLRLPGQELGGGLRGGKVIYWLEGKNAIAGPGKKEKVVRTSGKSSDVD